MGQNLWLMAILLLTAGVGLLLSVLNLLGASLYDIGVIRKQRDRLRHPFAKQFRHKPLVSIIIPAHNEARSLERCLSSILKSSYRKFEIIVIDDASTDETKQMVKRFINANRGRTIRLLSRRKSIGKGGAINDGYKKRAKGELIMALDAGSTLDKDAVKNIVRHFVGSDISILTPNARIMEHPSIVGLLQQFGQLADHRPKKFNSLLNAEWDASGSGVVYQSEIFKKLKGFKSSLIKSDTALSLAAVSYGNKKLRLYYASDVIVFTEPKLSYKSLLTQRYTNKLGRWQALRSNKGLFMSRDKSVTKSLTWFKLPIFIWRELMVLFEPLIVAYFIYLALAFKQPVLLAIGWLFVSFLFLFTIWTDKQSRRQKIKLTAYLPIMYPLLLVMTLIDVIATFISLVSIKKITSTRSKPPRAKNTPLKKLARATN